MDWKFEQKQRSFFFGQRVFFIGGAQKYRGVYEGVVVDYEGSGHYEIMPTVTLPFSWKSPYAVPEYNISPIATSLEEKLAKEESDRLACLAISEEEYEAFEAEKKQRVNQALKTAMENPSIITEEEKYVGYCYEHRDYDKIPLMKLYGTCAESIANELSHQYDTKKCKITVHNRQVDSVLEVAKLEVLHDGRSQKTHRVTGKGQFSVIEQQIVACDIRLSSKEWLGLDKDGFYISYIGKTVRTQEELLARAMKKLQTYIPTELYSSYFISA